MSSKSKPSKPSPSKQDKPARSAPSKQAKPTRQAKPAKQTKPAKPAKQTRPAKRPKRSVKSPRTITPGTDNNVRVLLGELVEFRPMPGKSPENMWLSITPSKIDNPPLFKVPFNTAFEVSPLARGEYTYTVMIGTDQEPIEGKIVVNPGGDD